MPAYIPAVFCAKCNKEIPYGKTTAMRIHHEKQRYILVRCHGEELKIPFADKPGQTRVLWQDKSDSTPESELRPT